MSVTILASCAKPDNKSDKLSIVTTIFPYYDITREITKDKADLEMLISPGSEPHEFEPTPSDIVRINKADIFIYNGGESDEWVENILKSIDSGVKVLKMFDYADLLFEEDIEHNKGDEFDEHIWTSLKNAEKFTEAILDNVSQIDFRNTSFYKKNAEAFIDSLNTLDKSISDTVSDSLKKPIVIADRFPLLYFFKEYGISCESAFPGCTSETQPSPKTVTKLIDFVKENDISTVYKIDTSSDALGKTISGGNVLTLYSLHNITKEQFDEGVTFISLIELNRDALKKGLG